MPNIKPGPAGDGWIELITTQKGSRWVAKWMEYVPESDGKLVRKKSSHKHELGPRVKHGPEGSLKSKKDAEKQWAKVRLDVFGKLYPQAPAVMDKDALRASYAHYTFEEFTERVWKPRRLRQWEQTTQDFLNYLFGKHIYPEFTGVTMTAMNEADMQAFIDRLGAEGWSTTIVKKSRTYLISVLELAKDLGTLKANEAELTTLPKKMKKPKQQFISLEQYLRLVPALPTERDRLMVMILFFCGVRRNELVALQWKDFVGDHFLVRRQFREKTNETVEYTKGNDESTSENEARKVAIPPKLQAAIRDWQKYCPSSAPNAFIFPSQRVTTCINSKNWLERVLQPAGEKVGLHKITFHWFRRGLATELHQRGAADRNIQSQLGHADPATTRSIYIQGVDEAQFRTVAELEQYAEQMQSALKNNSGKLPKVLVMGAA